MIQCAANQDYDRFYEGEIRMRELRRCPPFADLFTITVSGLEEGAVLRAAMGVREVLRYLYDGSPEPEVLGPAPAPVLRLNSRYRYRLLLVGKNDKTTRDQISRLLKDFAGSRTNRGLHISASCNTSE